MVTKLSLYDRMWITAHFLRSLVLWGELLYPVDLVKLVDDAERIFTLDAQLQILRWFESC